MADRIEEVSNRFFWRAFVAAWLALLSLMVSTEALALGPGRLLDAAGLALLGMSPVIIASIGLALNRRRLLRPEWTVGHALRVHLLVGLLFAIFTGGSVTAISVVSGVGGSELIEMSRGTEFAFRTAGFGFLYVVFVGYLMWFEPIQRVQESHRLVAREAVLRAEAEAKAIRAQFNPHFVFNTLHSLMLLVRADPATAEQAIEDVATLIRYASILQRRDIDGPIEDRG